MGASTSACLYGQDVDWTQFNSQRAEAVVCLFGEVEAWDSYKVPQDVAHGNADAANPDSLTRELAELKALQKKSNATIAELSCRLEKMELSSLGSHAGSQHTQQEIMELVK
eukprot:TRINITY_DN32890_c0_g1_i1.p1 TRINITY_DN32890_c0_g1~~TRINITY_DN32890_c0_g1_i1.p1  ORF type:complete len:119 (+),score=23.28 TRINITY_DN32890_c0_g1_i1:26-358(+)